MSLSSFRINQPPGSGYANWDRARQDIDLYSVASERVELEAQNASESSYLWEIVSAPYGVTVSITNPTANKCNFEINDRGPYIARLTVNEGGLDESISLLYFSVASEGGRHHFPALNETNEDNSESPYTGERGTEIKQSDFVKSIDRHLWSPVKLETVSRTILASESGYDFMESGSGIELTLPVAAQGLQFCFEAIDNSMTITCGGSDEFRGDMISYFGGTWTSLVIQSGFAKIFVKAIPEGSSYHWRVYLDSGSLYKAGDAGKKWVGGVSRDELGYRRASVIAIADCTAAPPTETDGDRYILDNTAGTVHADWDGAAKLDIVQFNGTSWVAATPQEGWIAYVDDRNMDAMYVDDGTPDWELHPTLGNGERKPKVIDIVDNTAAPPTEVTGDRYILDFTGGGVNPAWDGASAGDIVEFNGTTWEASTPTEGWVAYVDDLNLDACYIDDGTPEWELRSYGLLSDGGINALSAKTSLVNADIFLLEDSADSWSKKKVTLENLCRRELSPLTNLTAGVGSPWATVTVDDADTAKGDMLYMAADGHYERAIATARVTGFGWVIALEDDDGSKKVGLPGCVFRNDSWSWTVSASGGNIPLYISSTTPGGLVETPPSGDDTFTVPAALAIASNIIIVGPFVIAENQTVV